MLGRLAEYERGMKAQAGLESTSSYILLTLDNTTPMSAHHPFHLHLHDEANLVCPPLLLALQRLPFRLQRNGRPVRPYRQPTHSDQP